ncbi:TetR/AcrR family transcriptional regulator [Psychrobacillus lasiicapitis]|uniref:TetR/AcrR family transcriptional regulator n=1 Tax=Psychrobacillus lasiicapitis TaxID=1636719 RepID=A0A544T2V7_9BACI|nr:TetR/AcrR family transcriptional regulator [Psychrobacillus lasiicapitis]TQR11773.1 TetR/AcrR family transcriptional regulator [Psychrobacillus lasiicapitis]GGA19312.1 TetR family transcriptional regulator [Psychrobacillus lasiicapitis]
MKLSEKKLQKKKQEIILSAVKIVNQKGYQGATMEEIAAELLMTKGSLYYYFKNKEDLLFQCHEMVLGQAINELQDYFQEDLSNEQKLRKMIANHIRYMIEEKETFNMIIKPDQTFSKDYLHPILRKRNEYAASFDEVIQKGVEEGEFTIKEPKMARMILLGSMNWIQQWYRLDGDKSIEELQAIYADYLLKVVK